MLQFHLVPTGKMMSIHLSKGLLGWHLLLFVSCWLEGEGGNVQETNMLEGSHFVLWDLGLPTALPSSANSFLLELNQIPLCLLFPLLPLLKGWHGERWEQRLIKGIPIPCISGSSGGPWLYLLLSETHLHNTWPLSDRNNTMLNSHPQVKVYLGLWRQYSALKIIHTIPSVLVWHDCCFVLVYCFGLVYCLVLVMFYGRFGGFGVGFFCEIFRVVFCLFGWLVFLFGFFCGFFGFVLGG